MTVEDRDMQIRKYLKRVGVESHEVIKAALDAASGDALNVRMVLTIGGDDANATAFETDIDAS